MVLFAGVTLSAAKTWHSNALMERAQKNLQPALAAVPAGASQRYAYELGERPDFYARNGLAPASSIQFFWALPGTGEHWPYVRPKAASAKLRWLEARQSQNLPRLYADFAKTPPSYILFRNDYMRIANASGTTGIPGFQAYLDRNCRLEAQTLQEYSFYECGGRSHGEASLRRNFGD